MVTPAEVSRFMSPPPSTLQSFERFIAYSRAQQTAGQLACYVVTLGGYDTAIGLFQVRAIDREFKTAEWGFVLGSPFWSTGIFAECAELVLEFAFTKMGVRRMEARVAVKNGRGNRALQKIGAVQEGILPRALLCSNGYVDQVIYSIVENEWRAAHSVGAPRVVVH
jgi:RimJ/RimL family protein N-acetyltransferase